MKGNKSTHPRRTLSHRPITPTFDHSDPHSRSLHRSETFSVDVPAYSLRKGQGFWELSFAGQCAVFKHEQGAFFAEYLLSHPSAEPIHGLALALEIKTVYEQTGGSAEVADPTSGRSVRVANNARLQQRSLGLDDAEAVRQLHRKQKELEALLEDEDQIEPVKAEAQRELEAIYRFQKQNAPRIRTSAEKAADAVGKAIKRLYRHLASSVDAEGNPHAVLRSFAEHLKEYLLLPSGRCGGAAGCLRSIENAGGCFVYRPPAGVVWERR